MLRTLFAPVLLAAALVTAPALATEPAAPFEAFSVERFEALQREGRPVLVDVHADWCPTCRRQSSILVRLLGEEAFADMVALKLDWDAQRAEARALGAPRQSTLFVFRGGERRTMSVAETDESRLREVLGTALD
jgi:thioredoxin 1